MILLKGTIFVSLRTLPKRKPCGRFRCLTEPFGGPFCAYLPFGIPISVLMTLI
jgi:hypothetical protein